jgi:hypothetical protein
MARLMSGDDAKTVLSHEAGVGVIRLTLKEKFSQHEQPIFLRPIEVHPKNGD